MTPDGYFDCKRCGTSWSATGVCHCAKCHRTFSGVEGFDLHQRVTCDKKTCTPDDPCDGVTRRHYPTGTWTVHCGVTPVEGELFKDETGRIRAAARPGSSRARFSRREDEDG